MCDERDTRKIRIVKLDRNIPIIQLLGLAAVLILLGLALSPGRASATFLTLALLTVLASIAWRVRGLYRNGITLEVQPADDDEPGRLVLVAEEVADADEAPATTQAPDDEENQEEDAHWTEHEYPDPDVELGLKPPPGDQAEPEEEENVIR